MQSALLLNVLQGQDLDEALLLLIAVHASKELGIGVDNEIWHNLVNTGPILKIQKVSES